jgi:hypothetical protein
MISLYSRSGFHLSACHTHVNILQELKIKYMLLVFHDAKELASAKHANAPESWLSSIRKKLLMVGQDLE